MVPDKLENGTQCFFNKFDCRLFISKFSQFAFYLSLLHSVISKSLAQWFPSAIPRHGAVPRWLLYRAAKGQCCTAVNIKRRLIWCCAQLCCEQRQGLLPKEKATISLLGACTFWPLVSPLWISLLIDCILHAH